MKSSIKFVSKPWGYEKWIVNNSKYCGKILYVIKNKYCSYHYHNIKEETFHILSGVVLLKYSDIALSIEDQNNINKSKIILLEEGDTFNIPIGMRHRFFAFKDSEILEVSTHHEDSDSIRVLPSCPIDF